MITPQNGPNNSAPLVVEGAPNVVEGLQRGTHSFISLGRYRGMVHGWVRGGAFFLGTNLHFFRHLKVKLVQGCWSLFCLGKGHHVPMLMPTALVPAGFLWYAAL